VFQSIDKCQASYTKKDNSNNVKLSDMCDYPSYTLNFSNTYIVNLQKQKQLSLQCIIKKQVTITHDET
jgi:hypothetical protein